MIHQYCLEKPWQYHSYEGNSQIIDIPLVFWTLSEIKNSAHGKVKRED